MSNVSNQDYLKQKRLYSLRHSLAHLFAAALLKLHPTAKITLGPPVEDGFYYDFDLDEKLTLDDLPKIEKEMRRILPTWEKFEKIEVAPEAARRHWAGNPYKLELIDELVKQGQKITFYKSGDFVDLCRGGHIENPRRDIRPDAFKLTKIAGAYWRGDERNKMLTRVYGVAFETKEELDQHLKMLAEAEKRDHKILGPQLELFMFHPTAPGEPYWLPKGMVILNELLDFWRKEHARRGYQEVSTPVVNKKELWEISGHWEHYRENMFVANMGENEIYGVKAMNCPSAMVIFGSKLRSYRDLPLRLSDADILHRYELAGTLNGLLRVRSFRQDDSHNFITKDMIESEYNEIFKITELFYGIFKMEYRYRLGTRPQDFLGDVATWDRAEAALKRILEKSGKDFSIKDGDGAFYGPKIDILMKDALGREWQTGTIQLDFQQPKRFNLEYIGKDGSRKTPVVIHRVIYGSLERFVGLLLEHYAGAFPLWLSPVQLIVLPISKKQNVYARKILKDLVAADSARPLRVELDDRDESIGKKIREATLQKIPYMVILGEKEAKLKKIAVRTRAGKDLGQMSLKSFLKKIKLEIEKKK